LYRSCEVSFGLRHRQPPILLRELDEWHDVRVVEIRLRLDLALEPSQSFGVAAFGLLDRCDLSRLAVTAAKNGGVRSSANRDRLQLVGDLWGRQEENLVSCATAWHP